MAFEKSFLVFACLVLLATAGPARALSIDPNPFVVDHGAIDGTVELVDVVSGLPTGGSVGIGIIPLTGTTLVFQVRIDATSDPAGGLWLQVTDGLTALSPDASGWIPGPDTDIVIFGTGGVWRGFVPDSTAPGTQIDLVFLSYLVPLAADGSLRVEAGLLSGPITGGSALLVPEPATALLVGMGLCGLAAARRKRA